MKAACNVEEPSQQESGNEENKDPSNNTDNELEEGEIVSDNDGLLFIFFFMCFWMIFHNSAVYSVFS